MPEYETAEQAADQIEHHVVAGELPPARALLNQLLLDIGQDVEAFKEPGQVPFYAGLAFVCVRLKRSKCALHYAELALLNDAQDVLVHALLSEAQKMYFAREFIRRGRTAAAVAILELVRETLSSAAAGYMLDQLAYFEAEQARIRALPRQPVHASGRRPLLMNIIVWGKDYVDSLLELGLPSLMADGNIPHCARGRDVIVDVYTGEADRQTIERSAIGVDVARHASLQFHIIPDRLLYPEAGKAGVNADRWCNGGAQLCSALRAWQIGADLTFITTSGVYSDECFASAFALLDDGYGVAMTCTPRARAPAGQDTLRDYAKIESGRIDIDAASLVSFIVDNLHPHCRNLFLTDPAGSARQDPTTLYFKTPSGYASRTFQPSPLLISHELLRGDFTFDYMTTDARFVAELLRGRDPQGVVKIADNPRDGLVVVDVDSGAAAGMKEYPELPVTVAVCAACALGTAYRESDLGFYEWLLRQRFAVASDGGGLPGGGVDEDDAVARLLEIIHQGSGPVIEKIRMYEKYTISGD